MGREWGWSGVGVEGWGVEKMVEGGVKGWLWGGGIRKKIRLDWRGD